MRVGFGRVFDRSESFAVEMPAPAEGTPLPEWVNIVPTIDPGGYVRARDGRVLFIPDPARLVAESNAALARQAAPGADVGPGPVDKDHELYDWFDGGGPCVAWAHEFQLRDDRSIWVRVEWLAEGAALISAKQYRYTSAVFAWQKAHVRTDEWGYEIAFDIEPTLIEGFAITNIPALEVRAMFNMSNQVKARLLQRFGLEPTATLEQLDAAAEARLAASTAAPSLDQFVPRAEFDRVSTELKAAAAKLTEIEDARVKAEIEALLSDAVKAGKVAPAPANLDFYRAGMQDAAGRDRFRAFIAAAPALVNAPTPALAPLPETNVSLTAVPLSNTLKALGYTPETFAAAQAARRAELNQLRESK